jgi:hypothetical protein
LNFNLISQRTISNEVSFIHFRVAESQFFRLVGKLGNYSVTKVRYICQPYLVKQFERRRAEMAVDMKISYKQNKPILTYLPMAANKINEFIDKGDLQNGYSFTMSPDNFLNSVGKTLPTDILFCLVLLGRTNKTNSNFKSKPDMYDSTQSYDQLNCKVFDMAQVLPYYIVTFGDPIVFNPQKQKLLDDEWKNMEGDAKADFVMNDVQKFYQESLKKKKIEKSFGDVDSNSWFDQYYSKKSDQEKLIEMDDLLSPTLEVDEDIDYEIEITPKSSLTDGSYDFDTTPNME